MRKIILTIVVGVLTLSYSAIYAQEKIENRGLSLREISDDVQYEIGKGNVKLDFTDKKTFYGNCNLNWRSTYQLEYAYKLDSSRIETEALKISYVDVFAHKIIDLYKLNQKLEICQKQGNLYVFRYERASKKDHVNRAQLERNEKKRQNYIEKELKRFPGCTIEPIISKELGDRILVGRYYYDIHHFMWRRNATDEDFLTEQMIDDVVVTEGLKAEASTITGVLGELSASEWDNGFKTETDSINYAYVFTRFEGRMAIVLYYTYKGEMIKTRIIPRPKAEFENIKFTAETSKDVHEMTCDKGIIQIKIKPQIKGMNLNMRAKTAIEWKITFGDSPGTDTVERIGEVPL